VQVFGLKTTYRVVWPRHARLRQAGNDHDQPAARWANKEGDAKLGYAAWRICTNAATSNGCIWRGGFRKAVRNWVCESSGCNGPARPKRRSLAGRWGPGKKYSRLFVRRRFGVQHPFAGRATHVHVRIIQSTSQSLGRCRRRSGKATQDFCRSPPDTRIGVGQASSHGGNRGPPPRCRYSARCASPRCGIRRRRSGRHEPAPELLLGGRPVVFKRAGCRQPHVQIRILEQTDQIGHGVDGVIGPSLPSTRAAAQRTKRSLSDTPQSRQQQQGPRLRPALRGRPQQHDGPGHRYP